MEIKTKTYTVIEASEGFILTNGTAYGSSVALGVGDSPDNWHEITVDEYNEIMKTDVEEGS